MPVFKDKEKPSSDSIPSEFRQRLEAHWKKVDAQKESQTKLRDHASLWKEYVEDLKVLGLLLHPRELFQILRPLLVLSGAGIVVFILMIELMSAVEPLTPEEETFFALSIHIVAVQGPTGRGVDTQSMVTEYARDEERGLVIVNDFPVHEITEMTNISVSRNGVFVYPAMTGQLIDTSSALRMVDLKTMVERPFNAAQNPKNPSISPDGTKMLFEGWTGERNPDTGERLEFSAVADFQNPDNLPPHISEDTFHFDSFDWSPNSRYLVVRSINTHETPDWLVDTQTNTRINLDELEILPTYFLFDLMVTNEGLLINEESNGHVKEIVVVNPRTGSRSVLAEGNMTVLDPTSRKIAFINSHNQTCVMVLVSRETTCFGDVFKDFIWLDDIYLASRLVDHAQAFQPQFRAEVLDTETGELFLPERVDGEE